jgi:hypothetical protein
VAAQEPIEVLVALLMLAYYVSFGGVVFGAVTIGVAIDSKVEMNCTAPCRMQSDAAGLDTGRSMQN